MRDLLGPGTLLGYCANVHAAGTLDEMLDQLDTHATEVRRLLSTSRGGPLGSDEPLPVGLWIPARRPRLGSGALGEAVYAASTLLRLSLRMRSKRLRRTRAFLEERGLTPFTCNAFPLRAFHDPVVKRGVYEPDWTSVTRTAHTAWLFGAMDQLNPVQGGCPISTLPIGWPGGDASERLKTAGERLRVIAELLGKLESDFGVISTLDLEPEPGCLLDTADDVADFFDRELPEESQRLHIGVCHDVCHAAVMFEDQRAVLEKYADAGIRVNKVQISSALEVDVASVGVPAAIEHLRAFAEPRYLHQTGFFGSDGFELIEDLPDAIARLEAGTRPEWIRVHFHVPVFLDAIGPLGTTNDQIADAVIAARELHDCRFFEVETYAWGVLPPGIWSGTLAEGIAAELRWVCDRARDWGLGA
ncbi:MAG: metabolite traffic protein EboE [Phycisphaerales bacterium JB037]